MIKKNTVLILGAGASTDYGFPLGFDLRKEIIRRSHISFEWREGTVGLGMLSDATELKSDINQIAFLHFNCGIEFEKIHQFNSGLINSPRNSIDAFLQGRPEFLELGKLLITMAIFSFENKGALANIQPMNNWYRYLFNCMADSWDEFRMNKVHVVTYNYDRSFETYFIGALMATFGKSFDECADAFYSTITVVHVHGLLSGPHWVKGAKPYNGIVTVGYIRQAAGELKIIHEEADLNENYERVHTLLRNAEQIFILGFGYDQRNLSRLKIDTYKAPIYSTRTGITDLNVQRLKTLTRNRVTFSESKDNNISHFFENEVSLYGYTSDYISIRVPEAVRRVNAAKRIIQGNTSG